MTDERKFCPYCGEVYLGTHVCKQMQSYSDNIIEMPKRNNNESMREVVATDDDGTVYREAGTEGVQRAEYGICEICLKPKRLENLTTIYIEVPSYMEVMTGNKIMPQKACADCIKQANK